MTFDNKHMRAALGNALYAEASSEVPVGAVIDRELQEKYW
jgi:tRNA(Arg) A34 adenosine deaminase TadA